MVDYDNPEKGRERRLSSPGIDTGLSKAVAERLNAEKWTPIIDRAIRDAQNGDVRARDFLYAAAVACY